MGSSRIPNKKKDKERKAMKHVECKKIISVLLLAVLIGVMAAVGYFSDHLFRSVTVEAGQMLDASQVWTGMGQAQVSGAEDAVDYARPGVYQTKITLWNSVDIPVEVTVQDTIAPSLEVQKVIRNMGEECEISDFILSTSDATELTFSYADAAPDFTKVGTQEIQIAAVDMGGNQTVAVAELFVPNVRDTVTMELGDEVPGAESFLFESTGSAAYETDVAVIDTMVTGSNKIDIVVDGEAYVVTLVIADTVAPTGVVEPASGWTKKEILPDTMVSEIEDKSEVAVSFKEAPDWELEGEQEVIVCLTDASGNVSEYPTTLTLEADKIAPRINAGDIRVNVGKTVSYKKAITVTDNCDMPDEITLEIDTSNVNLKKIGKYTVTCKAIDTAGNEASKKITVRVVAEDAVSYDLETVNEMADKVLAKIIKPDMTPNQKCRAIFDWVKKNVSYLNNSEKGNWLRGAYEGFTIHKGDCYVYYATSRALLTRAGIENLEIKKEQESWTTQSNHYWNLVNLGDGWYHFDTTPRKDKTVFYMWTDAQIKEYSDSHKGTHNFTRELYPAIN